MTNPMIFNVSAMWDAKTGVWAGHCDDIPAVAEGATLDELFGRISRMAVDVAPQNYPGLAPEEIYIQMAALRTALSAATVEDAPHKLSVAGIGLYGGVLLSGS